MERQRILLISVCGLLSILTPAQGDEYTFDRHSSCHKLDEKGACQQPLYTISETGVLVVHPGESAAFSYEVSGSVYGRELTNQPQMKMKYKVGPDGLLQDETAVPVTKGWFPVTIAVYEPLLVPESREPLPRMRSIQSNEDKVVLVWNAPSIRDDQVTYSGTFLSENRLNGVVGAGILSRTVEAKLLRRSESMWNAVVKRNQLAEEDFLHGSETPLEGDDMLLFHTDLKIEISSE